MIANAQLLKALDSAQDKKNHHKMSTLGHFVTDSGPALQARCVDCWRYIFQFSDGSVAGTAKDRECGDRVPAR